MPICGMHARYYSTHAADLRAFLRDKLGMPAVDVGDGWLILTPPAADLGCHPTAPGATDEPSSGSSSISFWCDDIVKTMAELRAKGVVFTGEPENFGYGLVTRFEAPGGFTIQLYQPLHRT